MHVLEQPVQWCRWCLSVPALTISGIRPPVLEKRASTTGIPPPSPVRPTDSRVGSNNEPVKEIGTAPVGGGALAFPMQMQVDETSATPVKMTTLKVPSPLINFASEVESGTTTTRLATETNKSEHHHQNNALAANHYSPA